MYSISNRRYTGSKYKLLDWIEKLILENCEGDSFFDVFAGTGVVSAHMSKHYKKVIMNDFLYSNEIIYKAFFGNGEFDKAVIEKYREQFRKINPNRLKDNYFSENFGFSTQTFSQEKTYSLMELARNANVNNLLDTVDLIKYLTIYPAKILRLDNSIGSIEIGKDADFNVFKLFDGEDYNAVIKQDVPFAVYSKGRKLVKDGELRFSL